ncbi:hypothetical protein ACG3RN_20760, partial [Pseudomonas aeruginosa]
LIDRKVDGGFRALLSAQDQFEFDCILHALLHREFSPPSGTCCTLATRRTLIGVGRPSSDSASRVHSPAPSRFLERAVATWAIPMMKGKRRKAINRYPDAPQEVVRHEQLG